MNTARHTTLSDLFVLFEALQAQQRGRRLPVRPQDAADDYDARYEREASAADARHQQLREER